MDYLIYAERNAENLQFYLWYIDYVRRWNELPANDRALSPEWQPQLVEISNLLKEKDERSLFRPSIKSPVKIDFEKAVSDEFDGKGVKSDRCSYITASATGSVLSSVAEINAQAGLKWQPCGSPSAPYIWCWRSINLTPVTIQPYRDECDQILRHYIAHNSPRELNLSHKDRARIVHALQHTTHPSAFEPAFKIADATLRGQSHPNFIRWSICNGNKPRVIFVRSLGIKGIITGFVIATVLTLSHVPRWYRIFAALFWFLGFSTIIAAHKGLCLILHTAHSRNLRPWELADDISIKSQTEHSRRDSNASSAACHDMQPAERVLTSSDVELQDEEALRFERASMNTFGPKNEWERERWEQAYQRRSLVRKVFEKSVWTQNETIRVLQDRIVLGANVWGLIIVVPLTVAFVVLPSGYYF